MWPFKKKQVSLKEISTNNLDILQRRLVKRLTNMREEYFNQNLMHDRKYIDLIVKVEEIIYREVEQYKQELNSYSSN